MDSFPVPKPPRAYQSALAQASAILQEASRVLSGVRRSMAAGIDLRELRHGLQGLEDLVARLAKIRDDIWLHQYEVQLEKEGFPARPATDHATGLDAR